MSILFYLFWKIPIASVLSAIAKSAVWTVPVAIVLLFALYVCDSYSLKKTFDWFAGFVRFSDILVVRGASYFLAAVNYSVGQGAVVYFVHRAANVPLVTGIGTILLMMGVNMVLLLVFTSVGLCMAPNALPGLGGVVLFAYLGLLVYAVIVLLRPNWLLQKPVLGVIFKAGMRGHIAALFVRLPHLSTLIVLHFAMLHAFGIHVPLAQAIMTLPIVFFIAVLPISVQGLGTSQAAAVILFAPYVSGSLDSRKATILAYSLCTQVMGVAFQFLLGFVCLRTDIGRSLLQTKSRAPTANP